VARTLAADLAGLTRPAVFFGGPEELRAWFEAHRDTATELWAGIHKAASGLGGLTWAEAVLDIAVGTHGALWRLDGDELVLSVTVPPGTSAEVVLPDGRVVAVGPGSSEHRSPLA